MVERLVMLRREMKFRLENSISASELWRQALDVQVLELVKRGELKRAEAKIRNAIDSFRSGTIKRHQ